MADGMHVYKLIYESKGDNSTKLYKHTELSIKQWEIIPTLTIRSSSAPDAWLKKTISGLSLAGIRAYIW